MSGKKKETPSKQTGSVNFTREMTSNVDRIADYLFRKYGPGYGTRTAVVQFALASVANSLDESRPDFEYAAVDLHSRIDKV